VNEWDDEPARPSAAAALAQGAGVVVGWVDPSSTPERLWVDHAGNGCGPRVARTTIAISPAMLARAIAARQGALLVFENADPALPIIIGLIQTPEASAFEALLDAPRAQPEREVAREVSHPAALARPARPARLDGESVVLEGEREVVLRCGDASLTLRRDGKAILRGAYVETHSRGINRIKGGAVKIN
jgi:hypothetical protein